MAGERDMWQNRRAFCEWCLGPSTKSARFVQIYASMYGTCCLDLGRRGTGGWCRLPGRPSRCYCIAIRFVAERLKS
jgi:hypothetical protein